MQAFYSFSAPRIGRVWGEGITQASIWSHRWKPSGRREFWRRVWEGDFLRPRVRRRTRRGLRIAMTLALLGVLVGSTAHRLNAGFAAVLGAPLSGELRDPFWDKKDLVVVVESQFTDELTDWTDRPVNTDEWSPITMSNPEVSAAIFTGVVSEFLKDRPDLADVRMVLEQANGRVPHAVSMALADLSESVGASLRMGLSKEEVAALARLTSEYIVSLTTKGYGNA